jgi:RHS repeat-associated protein
MQASTFEAGTTIYPNQYYTVAPHFEYRHIFAGALGNVASFTWDGAAATSTYHLRDHLGSVHVDTDSGAGVSEYTLYTPFGDTLYDSKTDPNEIARFKYTGKEKDRDTGYYYYGARYYNAGFGRFLSQDPVFLAMGTSSLNKDQAFGLIDPQRLNSYSYARNNPITFSDPDGKTSRLATNFARLGLSLTIIASFTADALALIILQPELEVPLVATEAAAIRAQQTSIARMEAELAATESSVARIELGTTKLENVTVKSYGQTIYRGPRDLTQPLQQIENGTLKSRGYFSNTNSQLPIRSRNYYKEYEVKTPGWNKPYAGPERVIRGKNGEAYYSPDHYQTIKRIK